MERDSLESGKHYTDFGMIAKLIDLFDSLEDKSNFGYVEFDFGSFELTLD
jgi:hypothetical protein